MVDSVQIGGVRVEYREEGEGPPIIFLHGWGETGRAWDKVLPLASSTRRVIAPELNVDFEGCGPEAMGDLVTDFIEELGLKNAALAGHGMGARIALETALNYPRHADSVIAISGWEYGGLLPWARKALSFKPVAALFLKRISSKPERIRKMLRKWSYVDPFCVDEAALASHDLTARQMSVSAAQMRALGKTPLNIGRLREMRAPVAVVWGDSDRLTPVSQAWALHRAIEGSAIDIIERCGHCPAMEKPEALVAAIEKFLD